MVDIISCVQQIHIFIWVKSMVYSLDMIAFKRKTHAYFYKGMIISVNVCVWYPLGKVEKTVLMYWTALKLKHDCTGECLLFNTIIWEICNKETETQGKRWQFTLSFNDSMILFSRVSTRTVESNESQQKSFVTPVTQFETRNTPSPARKTDE